MIIFDSDVLELTDLRSGLPITVLRQFAALSVDTLAIPEMVLIEHLAGQRQIRLESLARAQRAAGDNSAYDDLDIAANIDGELAEYEQSVRKLMTVLPLTDGDAREALIREARRIPPAKESSDGPGKGARDAAIWLAVLRETNTSDRISFVSLDKNAFGDSELKQYLRDEANSNPSCSLTYCLGLDGLTRHLFEPVELSEDLRTRIADHQDLNQEIRGLLEGPLGFGTMLHQIPNEARIGHFVSSLGPDVEDIELHHYHAFKVKDLTIVNARVSARVRRRFGLVPYDGSTSPRSTWEIASNLKILATAIVGQDGSIVLQGISLQGRPLWAANEADTTPAS